MRWSTHTEINRWADVAHPGLVAVYFHMSKLVIQMKIKEDCAQEGKINQANRMINPTLHLPPIPKITAVMPELTAAYHGG